MAYKSLSRVKILNCQFKTVTFPNCENEQKVFWEGGEDVQLRSFAAYFNFSEMSQISSFSNVSFLQFRKIGKIRRQKLTCLSWR